MGGMLLSALSVLSACAPGDVTAVTPTAPASQFSQAATQVVRVDAVASPDQPFDGWMGDTLDNVLRVRVLDAESRPVAGAVVRFERAAQAPVLISSDAQGIAAAGRWVLAQRDTMVAEQRVSATLVAVAAPSVTFVARAWRDLAHFGGTSRLTLSALPIDRSQIAAILPLGTFGADDALPSADAVLVTRAGAQAVRAVADGLITEVDATAGTITLRVRDQIRIRLSGLTLVPSLWVGGIVQSGDLLGTSLGGDAALRVRVLDAAMQRENFARPERYGARRTATFFVQYLADSVRSAAYGLVRRSAPDLAGRIDFDRAGRLVGTWFDASAITAAGPSLTANASQFLMTRSATQLAEVDPMEALAPVALTFAYDAERPGQIRVALGSALTSALGLQGIRAVAWEDPDPADIDVARGLVRYHLYATDDEVRMGRADRVLLVQLVDAQTVRLEAVSGGAGDGATFSARAITLIR